MRIKLVPLVAIVSGIIAGAVGSQVFARERTAATRQSQPNIPPGESGAKTRLESSRRHGEWVMIHAGPGPTDSIRSWVVYPERSTKAPVVLVVHEIYGLTPWIRSVADQLAADGFIAIAPDLLTSKNLAGSPVDGPVRDQATAAIRTITADVYQKQLQRIAEYGMALPAATQKYGIVGYCWGGGASFAHATLAPARFGGSVVYYGSAPDTAALRAINTPVLGLYGGTDARISAAVPGIEATMKALSKNYTFKIFDGAGHGFLRSQDTRDADLTAAKEAWPMTVAFFKKNLEQ